jgi:hypothetical protein
MWGPPASLCCIWLLVRSTCRRQRANSKYGGFFTHLLKDTGGDEAGHDTLLGSIGGYPPAAISQHALYFTCRTTHPSSVSRFCSRLSLRCTWDWVRGRRHGAVQPFPDYSRTALRVQPSASQMTSVRGPLKQRRKLDRDEDGVTRVGKGRVDSTG